MSFSAATPAASATATIFDSKDDKQEVSDVINNTSNNVNNDNANNADSSNKDNDDISNNDVFLQDAQDIMNRASRKVGTVAMEDRRFRSFFGAWMRLLTCCGICWGRAACAPRRASPSICFGYSIS
jgi:hypothetical protein